MNKVFKKDTEVYAAPTTEVKAAAANTKPKILYPTTPEAAKNKKIVGDYVHSNVLFILGWIVVAVTAFMGAQTVIANIGKLFG